MPSLDPALSREIADIIAAQDVTPYHNAFKGMWICGSHARYVEGYVIHTTPGFVTRHAWVEGKGRIVDPTPGYFLPDAQVRYIAALRWTWGGITAELRRNFGLSGVRLPMITRHLDAEGNAKARARSQALINTDREALATALSICAELSGKAAYVGRHPYHSNG